MMPQPANPGRTIGARERLITLTYKEIAEWSGLSISTVRQYASRKVFDPRDIHSTLGWINTRREAMGLHLIGDPAAEPIQSAPEPPDTTIIEPQESQPVTEADAEIVSGSRLTHPASCKCSECYLASKSRKA